MGRDHQVFVREQFGRDVPLFNQICLGHDKPILDLHEVMPDWETDPERARAYVWSVIDVIWATAPALLSRLLSAATRLGAGSFDSIGHFSRFIGRSQWKGL
jgi:hypothetical protein